MNAEKLDSCKQPCLTLTAKIPVYGMPGLAIKLNCNGCEI